MIVRAFALALCNLQIIIAFRELFNTFTLFKWNKSNRGYWEGACLTLKSRFARGCKNCNFSQTAKITKNRKSDYFSR